MEVRLLRYPQYPWNNGIPVVVEIKLEEPAEKIEVLANVSTLGGVTIKPRGKTYEGVPTGNMTSRFVVLPYVQGEHRVNFTVISNRVGIIDSASVSALIELTDGFRVSPADPVTTGLYVWYKVNFVLLYAFLFSVFAYLFVTVFFRYFTRWVYKEVTKAV